MNEDLFEPPWLKKARREVGISELPGKNHQARIIEYHSVTKLKATDDETPWCAAFVCAMLEWSGIDSPKSAAAKSFLDWGMRLEKPSLGCIVVTERKGGHHVGFYVHESADRITLLGGNQSDKVCEMSFPKSIVLAYRMPDEEHWAPESGGDESLS